MKPIFLVGFPAVGKTTIGRELAKLLQLSFVDTDLYIERKYHSSVSAMIGCCGLEKFRKREKVILIELSQLQDVVIATGGGMASHDDNISTMKQRGTVVYLKASPQLLAEWLYLYRESRPAVAHLDREGVKQYVEATLPVREPFYTQADITIEVTAEATTTEVAEQIVQHLSL
ncbi:shikimate kinase [uncultured Porphyromonas sp.]|uniref:shikimate kinase n=1 Tax=uncultured Porphyromonas sp. TaxID=159274 RepID=UPI002598A114|nr:shikimate kinase [uncultured Porphyromonas sp.]